MLNLTRYLNVGFRKSYARIVCELRITLNYLVKQQNLDFISLMK